MEMLDIALACLERGWYVFPCWPASKNPMTAHGYLDASNNENQIRAWWAPRPDGQQPNVAIATGASGLCVLDIDHGLTNVDHLIAWLGSHTLPYTYAVRTGTPP